MGTVQDGTPDGPKLHSVIVDPRDPAHLYFAMSGGGVHESRDAGRSWAPLIGAWRWSKVSTPARHVPRPALRAAVPQQPRPAVPAEPLRHLPHRPAAGLAADHPPTAGSASAARCPSEVGDIGFPMVVHPRDADTAWVFPMDGTTVWPRTSPDGRPAAYVTRNAGRTWQRLDQGLPAARPGGP
jgi:hypothetical protein